MRNFRAAVTVNDDARWPNRKLPSPLPSPWVQGEGKEALRPKCASTPFARPLQCLATPNVIPFDACRASGRGLSSFFVPAEGLGLLGNRPGFVHVRQREGGISAPLQRRAYSVIAWVFVVAVIAFYARQVGRVGYDLREDFWDYWERNHFAGDMNAALNHGNMVLHEAQQIAQDEESQKTPEQVAAEQAQAAAGHPVATLMNPGPGLFETPFSAKIFRERWQHLKPIYGLILRGWVQTYEHLWRDVGEGGDFEMDYPPVRLLVVSLWAWNVQTNYPGVDSFPRQPQRVFDPNRNQTVVANMDIVQPMLRGNMTCEAISAISIFILVWLWMERPPPRKTGDRLQPHRRCHVERPLGRSNAPAPFVLFAVCTYFRSNVTWRMIPLPDGYESSLIDVRVTSVGWWGFLLLRFIAAVCLARFSPPPVPGSHVCPCRCHHGLAESRVDPRFLRLAAVGYLAPAIFLVAAICVTLNFWATAGLLLGLGCMFKGQLLFVAPVLILCPLFAGWPGRFLKLVAGMATGAGLVIWPWLVTNTNAVRWIFLAVAVATFFCAFPVPGDFSGSNSAISGTSFPPAGRKFSGTPRFAVRLVSPFPVPA